MAKEDKFPEIQASSINPFTGEVTTGNMASALSYGIPQGYHERVAQIWKNYDSDDGFSYLIDRILHYGVNGTSWRCKDKEQEAFWNEWSRRINLGLDNTIPGLDEIQKWNMKHLALGAMAVNQWQWGEMKIGGHSFKVPIAWTLHNELSAKLKRKGLVFGKEDVYIKIALKQATAIQNLSRYSRAYELDDIKNNYIKLKNAFALKYNYSPGDNTKEDVAEGSVTTNVAPALYPTPPFLTCNEFITMRKQLRALDMQTADGFINKILHWKIGDADHSPKPAKKDKDGKIVEESTITQVRKSIIIDDSKGTIKQLFTPFYVDLKILTPDIQPLLARDKYAEATVQLLWKFGILVAPSGDSRLNFTQIDVQNFEELIDFFRKYHYGRFIEGIICRKIVEANREKLTEIPSLTFNVLNTKDEEFKAGIRELMRIGKVSTRIGLQVHKINKDVVVRDLMEELDEEKFGEEGEGKYGGTSEKEMFDTNVPVSYKQRVVGEESEEQRDLGRGGSQTNLTPLDQRGRPKDRKNKEGGIEGRLLKMNKERWKREYKSGTPHWATDKEPSPLAKRLLDILPDKTGNKILEIGVGNGRDSIFLAEEGNKVIGIDIAEGAIKLAKESAGKGKVDNVTFEIGNVEKLKYSDEKFDAVYSISVLHSTILKDSLKEVARVLKPEGKVLLYLYEWAKDKNKKYIFYPDKTIRDLAGKNDLKVESLDAEIRKEGDGVEHKILVYEMQKNPKKEED